MQDALSIGVWHAGNSHELCPVTSRLNVTLAAMPLAWCAMWGCLGSAVARGAAAEDWCRVGRKFLPPSNPAATIREPIARQPRRQGKPSG